MILLIHQTLITTKGEQRVETLLQSLKFGCFDLDNSSHLTMPIESFLIGHRQTNQTHDTKKGETELHCQRKRAAQQLPAIVLMLEKRSKRCCVSWLGDGVLHARL